MYTVLNRYPSLPAIALSSRSSSYFGGYRNFWSSGKSEKRKFSVKKEKIKLQTWNFVYAIQDLLGPGMPW